MAKKAIGKVKTGAQKSMAKVILPTLSEESGAYRFPATILPIEDAKALLARAKRV